MKSFVERLGSRRVSSGNSPAMGSSSPKSRPNELDKKAKISRTLHKYMEELAKQLKEGPSPEHTSTLRRLYKASLDENIIPLFASERVIDILCDAIHCGDHDTVEISVGIAANIGLNESVALFLLDHGLLKWVGNLFKKHQSEDPGVGMVHRSPIGVRSEAARVLANIAGDTQLRTRILDVGMLDLLAELIHDPDDEVKMYSMSAIANICVFGGADPYMEKAHIGPELVSLLQGVTMDGDLGCEILRCAQNVSSVSDRSKIELVEANILGILSGILKRYQPKDKVSLLTAGTLCNLSCSEAVRPCILRDEDLTNMIMEGAKSEQVMFLCECLATVSALLAHEGVFEIAREKGVLGVATNRIMDENPTLSRICMQLIHTAAMIGLEEAQICVDHGVIAHLQCVLQASVPDKIKLVALHACAALLCVPDAKVQMSTNAMAHLVDSLASSQNLKVAQVAESLQRSLGTDRQCISSPRTPVSPIPSSPKSPSKRKSLAEQVKKLGGDLRRTSLSNMLNGYTNKEGSINTVSIFKGFKGKGHHSEHSPYNTLDDFGVSDEPYALEHAEDNRSDTPQGSSEYDGFSSGLEQADDDSTSLQRIPAMAIPKLSTPPVSSSPVLTPTRTQSPNTLKNLLDI